MVIYETGNPNKLLDAHVLDKLQPIADECQDWTYVDAVSKDGFLIFQGKRKLVTNDTQDHEVLEDDDVFMPAQKVIIAWGDSPTHQAHGSKDRARGALRWYSDGDELANFHARMDEEAYGFFYVQANNFTIPSNVTTYVNFCYSWNDFVKQGVPANVSIITIIGVEAHQNPAGGRLLHHASVAGTEKEAEDATCFPDSDYTKMMYTWTQGELP
jgi:hypothetical protein